MKALKQQVSDLEKANDKLKDDLMKEKSRYLRLKNEQYTLENTGGEYKGGNLTDSIGQKVTSKHQTETSTIKTEQLNEASCSECCRKAVNDLDKRFKKTQIKLAEAKAAKGALIISETKLVEALSQHKIRLQQTEDALERLKIKSRSLLRQYRAKKQTLTGVSSKITGIRPTLINLKELCKNKDENYKEILTHFGGQIEISARLLATYLSVPINTVSCDVNLKVSSNVNGWGAVAAVPRSPAN